MAFSITYSHVVFVCFRLKGDAQLFDEICTEELCCDFKCIVFLSCQSQTILNMALITSSLGGSPRKGCGRREGSESQQVCSWTPRRQLACKKRPAGVHLRRGSRLPRTNSSSCPQPWHGVGGGELASKPTCK